MTLQEFLQRFYADNPLDQAAENIRLYQFVMGWGQESQGCALIAAAMDAICRYESIHPDRLIDRVLVPMGLTDYYELELFVKSVDTTTFKAQPYLNITNPPVPDLGEIVEVPWNKFRYWIKDITGVLPNDLETEDTRYQLFHSSQIPAMVAACPVQYRCWEENISDCDDFNNGVKDWFSRWRKGNYGVVSIRATVSQGGKEYMHRFCGILTSDRKFFLWEPQGTSYWEWGTPSTTTWELVELDWIRH